ncbi:hypothetical protein CURE108131_20920 [Cupriavidus respiraculi]|uniref:Bacteriophage-related protein n=1 Tax=Cupriavidus respiraculi TaxID=195930 RepID=A0ABM8WZY2_9BURK|nr:hypothetical protein [Cupriavidus respiraculi]CAG9173158.1 hypothetical protein LMG21510_02170 [Cupriavidus respiraculi]
MTDFFDTVTARDAAVEAVDCKGNGLAALGTPACNMTILAIDIGTTTGWALGMRDGAVHGGSQSFAPRRDDGPGQRWLKFGAWLGERARQAGEIQVVYYERVLRHTAVQAAHVYGGFEAHLQAWADRNRIRLVGVPVPVIKKSATGKGNADKFAMIGEMKARGYRVDDDNHADALALLEYARQQEAA